MGTKLTKDGYAMVNVYLSTSTGLRAAQTFGYTFV